MIEYKMIHLILGFLLDKKVGVNQPKRIENAKILIANTPMDTDKIKVHRQVDFLRGVKLTRWEMDKGSSFLKGTLLG